MYLTGYYEHTVDTKNRIAIPSSFRSTIQRAMGAAEGDSLVFFVNPSDRAGSLRVFPERSFGEFADRINESGMSPERLVAFKRAFFNNSFSVDTDRQGRIRLPEKLLDRVELGSDVVVVGEGSFMSLVPAAQWHASHEAEASTEIFMDPDLVLLSGRSDG